jgi:predicted nucleic acid-binding protein
MPDVDYVFDTEPLLAYLYEEAGHDKVAELIDGVYAGDATAVIADPIAAEVLYKIARFEGAEDAPTPASLRVADRDVRALSRLGVTISRADWRLAGEIKAHGGLSLADAFAAALAVDRDATRVVGADTDFDGLPVNVDTEQIREDPEP